jgi:hypothetical protein
MTGKKTGFGSLVMFLSIQAAMFMAPAAANVPAPSEPLADAAAAQAAGPFEALSGLAARLHDAATDAFSFRWSDAPMLETQIQTDTYAVSSPAAPVEANLSVWAFEPAFETADLAALVKTAVDQAHSDWMF